MNFIPKFFLLIIILINISCEKKIHTVVFKNGTEESEVLVPPSGCYKTRFTATGNLNCELDLELYMDNKKTTFVDHLRLIGEYSNKQIYYSDWYGNIMQLRVRQDSCISSTFEIKVEFIDL